MGCHLPVLRALGHARAWYRSSLATAFRERGQPGGEEEGGGGLRYGAADEPAPDETKAVMREHLVFEDQGSAHLPRGRVRHTHVGLDVAVGAVLRRVQSQPRPVSVSRVMSPSPAVKRSRAISAAEALDAWVVTTTMEARSESKKARWLGTEPVSSSAGSGVKSRPARAVPPASPHRRRSPKMGIPRPATVPGGLDGRGGGGGRPGLRASGAAPAAGLRADHGLTRPEFSQWSRRRLPISAARSLASRSTVQDSGTSVNGVTNATWTGRPTVNE